MITILRGDDRTVKLKIYKGKYKLEDFTRALVKVWLINETDMLPMSVTFDAEGLPTFNLPTGLIVGTYSLKVVWVKNDNKLRALADSRAYMQAESDTFVCISLYEDECTNLPGDEAIVLEMNVSSYGYDGLSSYEIAVLRGAWSGTESEWLQHERYVSVLQTTGDSEDDTMSQSAITEGLESKVSKVNFGDIGEAEAQELWDEADPIETESSTADFVYATEEDIDGLND